MGGLVVSLILGVGLMPYHASSVSESPGAIMLPEVVIRASGNIEESRLLVQDILFSTEGLVLISLIISLMIFLRFFFSLIYLASMWRVLKGKLINGLLVIPTKTDRSPFSFFRLVFVPERLLTDPALDNILLHEKAHVLKLHSLDLILVEMLSVVFWFHPAIWYLRRQLKQQHEFEADRFVLGQNVDKIAYQQLMVNFSFKSYNLPITNPFNVSPLKQRIMMMNQTSRKPLPGYLFGIAATVLLFAGITMLQTDPLKAAQPMEKQLMATQEVSSTDLSIAATETTPPASPREPERPADEETIFTVVEEFPRFPGGEEARFNFIRTNLRYPEEARAAGIQGTVFVSFVIEKDGRITNPRIIRGIGYGCDEEVIRVIQSMPNWIPGRQRGQPVRVQFNMPFRFVLDAKENPPTTATADESPRITRIEGYGYINGKRFEINMENLRLTRDEGAVQPTIFIDGNKVDIAMADLNEILPSASDIVHINVFKGEEAQRLYQHDNVVSIRTRRAKNN